MDVALKQGVRNPFDEAVLDAVVTGPEGSEQVVPAFWAGGDMWKVRFASPTVGSYHLRSKCSDVANQGMHGQQVELEVIPYRG